MNYRFFVSWYDNGCKSFLSDCFSKIKDCKSACNEYIILSVLKTKGVYVKNICIMKWFVEQDTDEKALYTWGALVKKASTPLVFTSIIFNTCNDAIDNVERFIKKEDWDDILIVVIKQMDIHTGLTGIE